MLTSDENFVLHATQTKCDGRSLNKGTATTLEACYQHCRPKYSMFTFGLLCQCEMDSEGGQCIIGEITADYYDLYKISKWMFCCLVQVYFT